MASSGMIYDQGDDQNYLDHEEDLTNGEDLSERPDYTVEEDDVISNDQLGAQVDDSLLPEESIFDMEYQSNRQLDTSDENLIKKTESDVEIIKCQLIDRQNSLDRKLKPKDEKAKLMNLSLKSSSFTTSVVPQGVEIIDLDLYEFKQARTCIDLEEMPNMKQEFPELNALDTKEPDIIMHDNDHYSLSPRISSIDGTAKPTSENNLEDVMEDEITVTPIETKTFSNADRPLNEYTFGDPSRIVGRVTSSNRVHQDEATPESTQKELPILEPSVSGSASITKANIQPLKRFLTNKKANCAQSLEKRKAQVSKVQRILVETSIRNNATASAGGSFKRPQTVPEVDTPNLAQSSQFPPGVFQDVREAASNQVDEDPYAWMYEQASNEVDEEDTAAETFAILKAAFGTKLAAGPVTLQDEIEFKRAEKEEKARLHRLTNEQASASNETARQAIPLTHSIDEPEGIFLPDHPIQDLTAKRSRVVTEETMEMEPTLSASNLDLDRHPACKRSKPNKRSHEKILQKGLQAGFEENEAKHHKKQREKSQTNGRSKNTASRKKASEGKATRKPKEKTSKMKRSKTVLFQNIDSLRTSNIFVDANASHNKSAMPHMTGTKKTNALKNLLASVPTGDKPTATQDRNLILQATKDLGKWKCHPDPDGLSWRFKGMKASLRHHQVLGAAWMKNRETGVDDICQGSGILADEMGLGKTIQCLALIVANPPPATSDCKPTLIVVPSSLVRQWSQEINKHVEFDVIGSVLEYCAGNRFKTNDDTAFMGSANVIITTYSEILRSYPKCKPPIWITTYEQEVQWWADFYEKNRGVLHRIKFYRVILDEAQAIKNHRSQISVACRGLVAKHKWVVSGTPIQNSVDELYPYFKFLQVKHTGSRQAFMKNFCDKSSGMMNERIHAFLRQFMIRRTHADTVLGAPIVTLPKNHERTVVIEFNIVETAVYRMIQARYRRELEALEEQGILEKSYNSILTKLLRLRQLTAHVWLLHEGFHELFDDKDLQKLDESLNAIEITNPAIRVQERNMITQMRRMIAEKKCPEQSENLELDEADNIGDDSQLSIVSRFRKHLCKLSNNSEWDALEKHSVCQKCQDVPTEPVLMDCKCTSLYCKDCIVALSSEAAENDQDSTRCLNCGMIYNTIVPCIGFAELGLDEFMNERDSRFGVSERRKRQPRIDETKWVEFDGTILQSAKTMALIKEIQGWFEEDPNCKIIIFTQWRSMIKILEKICVKEQWGSCTYHGGISHEARDRTVALFQDDVDTKIMIASLKCGGVGLNLVMASRCICLDAWWNRSVEQQAFCRMFRIGQLSETFITRFIVKSTVDERLQRMQESKSAAIDAAMGDDGTRLKKLTVQELMRIFGPGDDDGNEFVLIDDTEEYENAVPLPTFGAQDEDNWRWWNR